MASKLKTVSLVAAGLVAGVLGTLQLQAIARSGFMPLPLEEMQQFAAVYSLIKNRYVEPADEKKLLNDAIGGMVSGLDAHSQYLDRKTYKEFRESYSGRFGGLGMEVNMDESGLVRVVSPIEGTPAHKAGVQTGDLISRIDDTPIKGMTLDQAIRRLRGEPGTKVTITIFRRAENRTFTLNLTRDEIKVQAVRAKVVEPGYAWVRINSFQERVVEEFVKKVEDI
ncbi:MAG: PDZ domain-containing protein, partial [Verrucomicrobiae bacterium]|nr:PDZ domain-containing protein [Verrucomicrobiae bacterium]